MEVPVVQWLSSWEMDTVTRIQILDETNCISHSTNTLGKLFSFQLWINSWAN